MSAKQVSQKQFPKKSGYNNIRSGQRQFSSTKVFSAPVPTHYYSSSANQYQPNGLADKSKYSQLHWNAACSKSTLADSKQFDDSNSSSFVYEYEAQSADDYADYNGNQEEIEGIEENDQVVDHDEADYGDRTYAYAEEFEANEGQDETGDANEATYWTYLNDYISSGDNANEYGGEMQSYSLHQDAEPENDSTQYELAQDNLYHYERESNLTNTNPNNEDLAKSELYPFTLEEIDERVDIRVVPGKGRCTFARRDYRPGDIIFVETPLLVATPELNPELWEILKNLHEAQNFELPPTWHLAALYSLQSLSAEDQAILFEKWVPDPDKEPSDDVWRVLESTNIKLDPHLYERALQVWRYNSFGHHSNTNGLALYNRISMLAHDCAASATWHYGINDAFTLRARQVIPKGSEISLSYIGDDDLLKATHVRQDKLIGWLFTCQCEKCLSPKDSARGFKCPTCGGGSVYFKSTREPYEPVTPKTTVALPCTICHAKPTKEDLEMYLELEEAYINRLKATPRDDLMDVEHVYSEAQRVFALHWILYQLDSILVENYRERKCWDEAVYHQSNRIRYVSRVLPTLSYTLAWLYEEMGDIYASKLGITFGAPINGEKLLITGFQKNFMVDKYETAMYKLLLISGPENSFTIAAHEKLEYIMLLGKGCFNEDS